MTPVPPARTAKFTTSISTMDEADPPTPPTPPPERPSQEVATTTPSTSAIDFSNKRKEMIGKLYQTFEDKWKPMIAAEQDNKLADGSNPGEVLEKLPEGKILNCFVSYVIFCLRTCPRLVRKNILKSFVPLEFDGTKKRFKYFRTFRGMKKCFDNFRTSFKCNFCLLFILCRNSIF
jgi:hypothetical protein